jgi:hypothetical protein
MTDKTKEYIDMVNCEEIQKLWEPCVYSDTVYHIQTEKICQLPYIMKDTLNSEQLRKIYIFLPDQRWFQEQYRKLWPCCDTEFVIESFFTWFRVNDLDWIDNTPNLSFEMIWCVFYMNEVHHKIWNNDKWIS